MSALHRKTACELAAMLRARELSAVEVLDELSSRAERLGYHEPEHFPLRRLIAQVVDHAAGELDFEQIGSVPFHEGRCIDQDWARLIDPPGNEYAAGVAFAALDDQLAAAEIGSPEPGQVVWAAHMNMLQPAGWDAVPVVHD